MRIITQEASNGLREFIKSLEGRSQVWRAQTFRFSTTSVPSEARLMSMISSIIKKEYETENGRAFIEESGDITILSYGITAKKLEEVSSIICTILPEGSPTEASDIYKLYDLGVEWQELYESLAKKPNLEATKSELLPTQQTAKEETKIIDLEIPAIIKRENRTKPVILLVEDDPLTQRLVRNTLNNGDFIVQTASTATEAISCYEMFMPDIVFLDIMLPDANGHEILKSISKVDASSFIVMLSGNCFSNEVVKAMNAGAKGFIAKPFRRDKLFAYIDKYFAERKLTSGQSEKFKTPTEEEHADN